MCGNYLREETIQGRKLHEEIRYLEKKSSYSEESIVFCEYKFGWSYDYSQNEKCQYLKFEVILGNNENTEFTYLPYFGE